jgi:hypothetical protein
MVNEPVVELFGYHTKYKNPRIKVGFFIYVKNVHGKGDKRPLRSEDEAACLYFGADSKNEMQSGVVKLLTTPPN